MSQPILQEKTDLTPRGSSVKHVFLAVGDKKYEATGKQAKEKLTANKGKAVKATCWLDGDDKCLRIADISEMTTLETSTTK